MPAHPSPASAATAGATAPAVDGDANPTRPARADVSATGLDERARAPAVGTPVHAPGDTIDVDSAIDVTDADAVLDVTRADADIDLTGDDASLPAPRPDTVMPGRRLPRRAVGVVCLLVLGGLGSVLAVSSSRVEVLVDGEVVGVRTFASSVGGVVAGLGVELGEFDEVRPDPSSRVSEGMVIDVARAVTVDVHVDGALAHRVVAPVGSVAGVLTHAGLGDVRELDAQVVPGWTAPVEDGGRVDVWVPHDVTLSVDGEDRQVSTFVGDVGGLLVEQGVQLGPYDLVSHGVEESLSGVGQVVVARVRFGEEVEQVVLPNEEIRQRTTLLAEGEEVVEAEGQEGLRYDRYRIVEVDGEPVERELLSEQVVREPETREVRVGIFTTTPPNSGMVDADDPVWDRLAQCEAGGNWQRVAANGRYYGGLQFLPSTWRRVGGTDMPHEHSREAQIEMARRLQARSGWGQWPACSARLGLR